MNTQKTTATGGDASTTDTGVSGPEIRRVPAHPGVIESEPVGAGKPAQAGQLGEVRAVGSTLVGDSQGGLPPAQRKSEQRKAAHLKNAMHKNAGPKHTNPKDRVPPLMLKNTTPEETGPKETGSASGPKDAVASPAPDSAPQVRPAASVPARRSGFWPVALGGAMAAGLGAAASIYASPHLPAAWQPQAVAVIQPAPDPQTLPDPQALMDAATDAGRLAAERVLAEAPPPRRSSPRRCPMI